MKKKNTRTSPKQDRTKTLSAHIKYCPWQLGIRHNPHFIHSVLQSFYFFTVGPCGMILMCRVTTISVTFKFNTQDSLSSKTNNHIESLTAGSASTKVDPWRVTGSESSIWVSYGTFTLLYAGFPPPSFCCRGPYVVTYLKYNGITSAWEKQE